MQGIAVRVPTPCGSLTDFVCLVKKTPTIEKVNNALKKASKSFLKGILEFSEKPLVSSDIIGNPHSAIVDSKSTQVVGNLVRVLAWYDNEFAYSYRLVEFVQKYARFK
jgi:glyceraldehyde 3-phosphate dehydrogenase